MAACVRFARQRFRVSGPPSTTMWVLACMAAAWTCPGQPAAGQPLRNADAVDVRPLPVGIEDAFPELRFQRPVIVTHAADGTGRLFVGGQLGRIFAISKRRPATCADVVEFLDLRAQVHFDEDEDEQGLLGLAFDPQFKQNGLFYVYYTDAAPAHDSVVARLRVDPNRPSVADPKSHQTILRIPQPYWNHNGGTLTFGPDGYLYIGLGDGGRSRDPWGAGQNPRTLLGSILRIDVRGCSGDPPYRIPPDNPFADSASTGRPEVWAYGLRNVWRMAFDPASGQLWAADNGEDMWEEINLIHRGGNYGWNLREGRHRFGPKGSDPRPDLTEPIWEYDHKIGQSIIGGCVYRGTRVPALSGLYVYGDYINGRLWGLRYDRRLGRVVANRPIAGNGLPILTFGYDEQGEVYFSTVLGGGIIYRFVAHNDDPPADR